MDVLVLTEVHDGAQEVEETYTEHTTTKVTGAATNQQSPHSSNNTVKGDRPLTIDPPPSFTCHYVQLQQVGRT